MIAIAALAMSVPWWVPVACPVFELFASEEKHALMLLKNRRQQPRAEDFDSRATLPALLEPGLDRSRWLPTRAARVEGFVVAVQEAGLELANCFSFNRRDIHIDLALTAGAPPRQRVVLEVTPPMRDWAQTQGLDWSVGALKPLVGRKVRFEGWLLFDIEHDGESENSRPGHPGNWRATAWEVHPVTSIELLE